MSWPSFVCPDNRALFNSLHGRSIAVRVDDPARISTAAENVWQSGNKLFCVVLEMSGALSALKLDGKLEGIRLVIAAESAGRFRDLMPGLGNLRRTNIHVQLDCTSPDNLVALKILSSLGVHVCADFSDGTVDWEELADLATYAVLKRVSHAPIDPFTFIATNYQPAAQLEWGRVIFDDPQHFLFLDEIGRVALSKRDLADGRFVAESCEKIDDAGVFEPALERVDAQRRKFSEGHPCAFCPGWRVCLGRFADSVADTGGCSPFFQEMIELARRHRTNHMAAQEGAAW